MIKKWRWWRRWRRKPILTPVTPEPHRLNFKRSSAVGEIQLRVRSIFSREVLMNIPPTGKHPWMGAVDGCEAACQSPAPPKKPLINKTLPVFSFSSLLFSFSCQDFKRWRAPLKLQLLYDKFLQRPGSDQSTPACNSPHLPSTFNSTSSPEERQHNGADVPEVHMQRHPPPPLTDALLLKCGSLG